MSQNLINDYDRVLAYLKRAVETASGPERRIAADDMIELLTLATHWLAVFGRDVDRKGDPFNLALLNWVGLNTTVRLPLVFKILGFGDMHRLG